MTSFYGGMPGQSCVIRKVYESIDDMKTDFATTACTVWYDDCVIIDTPNKNDKDNGKIYRRTADANNPIYIGQIVGPTSGTPHIQFATGASTIVDNIPTGNNVHYKYVPKDETEPIGTYTVPTAGDIKLEELDKIDTIPGKDDSGFNDKIKWKWVSVRQPSENNDSLFRIGFTIPYTVFEVAATSVSHTTAASAIITNEDPVGQTHPFWEKITFSIPKGVPGVSICNYNIIDYKSSTTTIYYKPDAFYFDAAGILNVYTDKEHKFSWPIEDPEYKDTGKIWTYQVYNNQGADQVVYNVAGLYDIIDNMTLSEDAVLTRTYTDKKDKTSQLDWVKNISVSTAGDITYTHADSRKTTTVTSAMTWVTNVALDDNGHLDVDFNNKKVASIDKDLTWVKNVGIDSINGKLTITKTTGIDTETTLKWPTSINIATNGNVTTNYTTGDQTTQPTALTWVDNIRMKENGDLEVHKTTDAKDDWTRLETVNYIKDIFAKADNYHILVEYATPKVDGVVVTGRFEDLNGNFHPATPETEASYNDLGSIKDTSGILFGMELTKSDIGSYTNIKDYLDATYPNGLGVDPLDPKIITSHDLHGKVVSYKETKEEKYSSIYACNYNKLRNSPWFYVGTTGGGSEGKTKITLDHIGNSVYEAIFSNVDVEVKNDIL